MSDEHEKDDPQGDVDLPEELTEDILPPPPDFPEGGGDHEESREFQGEEGVIRVRGIVFEDDHGNARMHMGISVDGTPFVTMMDSRMMPTAILHVTPDGPHFSMGDIAGNVRLKVFVSDRHGVGFVVADANGKERMSLALPSGEDPSIVMRDANGDARVFSGISADGRASVAVAEPGGAFTAQVVAGPKDSDVTVFDRGGNIVVSLPEDKKSLSTPQSFTPSDASSTFFVTGRALRWTAELTVGVQMLDEQHMEIFNRVNTLDAALRGRMSDVDTNRIIALLDEYLDKHFSSEELFMKRYGYPGLQAHVLEHVDLRKLYGSIKERIQAAGSNPMLALELNRKVGDWFINHIRGTDRAMGVYLLGVVKKESSAE